MRDKKSFENVYFQKLKRASKILVKIKYFESLCLSPETSLKRTKMPKRVSNLFDKIISLDHLVEVYGKAKIGKCRRHSKVNFEINLFENLAQIHSELKSGTYEVSPYRHFSIFLHKKREIYAPAFRDMIVQHAILDIINPIFDKTFIEQSHGCRQGHGILSASDYVYKVIKKCDPEMYYLQLDIRKYFYSIDRKILRKQLEKKIKEKELLNLVCKFADLDEVPTGVPIGNLLSQFFGLLYLNPLDHFIKRELKQEKYCRYVDDFIILGITKEKAKELELKIREFLKSELNLELSKVKLYKIKRGINFVGYRTWKHYRLVRKYCLKNFKKKAKNFEIKSVISMLGHCFYSNSYKTYVKFLPRKLYDELPEKCQNKIKEVCLKSLK